MHRLRSIGTAAMTKLSPTRDAEAKYCKTANGTVVLGIDEAGKVCICLLLVYLNVICGCSCIIDFVGRGPLAGPVVTAACFIAPGLHIDGINDSKQTTEEEREKMYEVLTSHPSVWWATAVVSHTEIDDVNILQATMNGMSRATIALLEYLKKSRKGLKEIYFALIDGNRVPKDMPIDAEFVIKGDGSIFSIAAASIIAKVT